MKRGNIVAGAGLVVAAGLLGNLCGCGDVWLNLTKERTGDASRAGTISVVFINNTPHRASFSFGVWDAWDKSPGPAALRQLRLEGSTSSAPASLSCQRNFAIGTQDFVDRVLETKADDTATFDPDAFGTVVNFSSAPTDSDAAALPTEGTALGVEKLLGVDYSCADRLIFTFVQDPDAAGGFRIDFEAILDETQQ